MKKLLKILLWTVAVVIGIVLIAFLSTPLWLGPLAKNIANAVAPDYTGTEFKIEKMHINPYMGTFRMEGFRLANPKGYSADDAATVAKLSVDVKILPLFSNKLHIENIDIIDPYVSYVGNDGTNNFDAILANVNNKLGTKDEEKKDDAKKDEKKEDKDGMKIVIDRFHVEGVKVKYGIMPAIPLLIPITLTDLGTKDDDGKKSDDGVSFSDMGKILSDQLSSAFSKAGGGISNIFGAGKGLIDNDATKAVGDAVKGLGEGASKAAGAVTDTLKNVGDSAAVKSVGEGASKAAGATVDAVKNVGGGAVDAAKSVGSGAADIATGAAKSVGDGAKSLFNGAAGLFGGDKKGDTKEEKK